MSIGRLARGVAFTAAVPSALCGGYLGTLTAASKRYRPSMATDRSVRFAVVVPAHNEAFGISETIASLRALDYPRHAFRVIVVADNCTDDTAAVARAAGAQVMERTDDARRSKGFALSDMLPLVLADKAVDAVVVVDADTVVSTNLLLLAAGSIASGELAMQARYGVRNPDDSWRTQLLAVAFACFHDVRSAGREQLGLSCGLRGNGMVFTREALSRAPHRASSLVEDLEHGLDLAEAGIRVAYLGAASVSAEMPKTAEASASQRDRWERGRAAQRSRALAMLRSGIRRTDRIATDLAADVLVPPLASVAAAALLSSAVAVSSSVLRRRLDPSLIPAAVAVSGLGVHVLAGWRASGTGVKGLAALSRVPGYVWWKVSSKLESGRGSSEDSGSDGSAWVRTVRNAESAAVAAVDPTRGSPVSLVVESRRSESDLDSGLADGTPIMRTATKECAS